MRTIVHLEIIMILNLNMAESQIEVALVWVYNQHTGYKGLWRHHFTEFMFYMVWNNFFQEPKLWEKLENDPSN